MNQEPADGWNIRTLLARLVRGFGLSGQRRDAVAIRATGLFDRARYLACYPEVAAAKLDPVVDYLDSGAHAGRNPCEFFDSSYYLETNRDVADAGVNPLLHFSEFGWRESRHPSAEFDVDWYIRTHLAGEENRINPLLHYLSIGRRLGLEIRPVDDGGAGFIRESGVFDEEYYRGRYPDMVDSSVDPLAHYLRHGWLERRNPSSLFDTGYYLDNNPEIAALDENPLLHFCRIGWKELRNPSRDFDVWWYWSNYMDPAKSNDNPLGHYQRFGQSLGFQPRPECNRMQLPGSGHRHEAGAPVRRICMFAGYDRDGIVDDYVVAYVRELAKHADVYYFADGEMTPGELAKLAPYVKAAWAERHGEYDFGSYSRLLRNVGWDRVEKYDELLLVNDSCYLLRSLDQVFERMDVRSCDWWGLQATKGLIDTRKQPGNRFRQPIPMDVVRGGLLQAFESEYQYDFHIGSYFVAYRQPVIANEHFRRLLDTVGPQDSKRSLILKYEVGLTRHLIADGYAFDTFIDALYPLHPIFTNWYFRLLDKGFPLLKRYLLSENHYAVIGLHDWAERIREKIPDVDVDEIRRNLERVVDAERLHRNLHIGSERMTDDLPVPDELLDDEAFRAADRVTPKYRNWWAFPVCAFTGVFSGNERALFEEVKNDPSIRKIVLTRGKSVDVDGSNVEVIPLKSPQGQHRLMRAGNLFVKHSATRNLVFPVSGDLHNIINLWHGIPFKRIGYASADVQERLPLIAEEHSRCRAVISSSKIDALAIAAAFYPLSINDIWNTGLPRNDFILRDRELLPVDMQEQLAELERVLDGRRLLLFMPTFRNAQEDAYYRFSDDEIAFIGDWMRRKNVVLGIREHMADSARVYGSQLAALDCLDLSDDIFPNVEMLYRASSALLTDYSSCFIDYMLTGKPAVSFAYDYARYMSAERGSFYDLDIVFPGRVCRGFGDLIFALEGLFDTLSDFDMSNRKWQLKLFFDHIDDRNSARVAERVRQLADMAGLGRPIFEKESK